MVVAAVAAAAACCGCLQGRTSTGAGAAYSSVAFSFFSETSNIDEATHLGRVSHVKIEELKTYIL